MEKEKPCNNCNNIRKINILEALITYCYHDGEYDRVAVFFKQQMDLKKEIKFCGHDWIFI